MGHFGYKKTYLKMEAEFYWPHMLKHIRKVVIACEWCQKLKISKGSVGYMFPITVDTPGDLVCLDLRGPLPLSRGGVTQLLVVVDHFSKYRHPGIYWT